MSQICPIRWQSDPILYTTEIHGVSLEYLLSASTLAATQIKLEKQKKTMKWTKSSALGGVTKPVTLPTFCFLILAVSQVDILVDAPLKTVGEVTQK